MKMGAGAAGFIIGGILIWAGVLLTHRPLSSSATPVPQTPVTTTPSIPSSPPNTGTFPPGKKSTLPSDAQNLLEFVPQGNHGMDVADTILEMQGLSSWEGSNSYPGTIVIKKGSHGAFRVNWLVPPGSSVSKNTWYDFRISANGNFIWPENGAADSILP